MSHITEHHSEEEWECDNRDWYWVGLEVSWYTISVYDQLENTREVSCFEVSWFWDRMVIIGHNLCGRVRRETISNLSFKFKRGPEVADELLALHSHLIQSFV